MQKRQGLWILRVLGIALLAGVLVCRIERLTDDAWTVDLPGHCDLDLYTSVGALALACPGGDLFRVWPLPVEHGWAEPEDTVRPAAGQLASMPALSP